jgi:tRNA-specific 2-thiouridylase
MAVDATKDQSYVLSALAPDSLARLRFPLGELQKPQVRAIAEQAGLAVARKRDSQDLCFLAGTRQAAFLQRHGGLASEPGPIVSVDGEQLGTHRGARTYTVGQRHGLGVGGREPLYVLATDAPANTVTVGPRQALLASAMSVRELTLHRGAACVDRVRVRAHGRTLGCRLPQRLAAGSHSGAVIELDEPAERTAPGQIACLYAGDVVVGHGTVAP